MAILIFVMYFTNHFLDGEFFNLGGAWISALGDKETDPTSVLYQVNQIYADSVPSCIN